MVSSVTTGCCPCGESFFDDSPDCNKPASELWGRVRQRGDAKVHFYVTAEEISGTSSLLLHAPETLRKATPAGRTAAETVFHRLTLPAERPLHAKAIWLEDDRYDAYLVGSSNFTSAGTGLRKGASNIEANLPPYPGHGPLSRAGALSVRNMNRSCLDSIHWPSTAD